VVLALRPGKLTLALLSLGLVLAAFAGLVRPAAASATSQHATVTTTGPGFFATAPLCPFGQYTHTIEVIETGVPFQPPAPFVPGQYPTLQALLHAPTDIVKGTTTFVCADGTGTFTFQWHAHGQEPFTEFSNGIAGRFRVSGGTGSYSHLSGEGTLQSLFGSCCGVGFSITFDGTFTL
jgi:hypothetical protein